MRRPTSNMEPMDSRPCIDVALAADANYVQHAAVVARSLIAHQGAGGFRLHFLHSGTTPSETLAPLVEMIEASGNFFVNVRIPDDLARRLKPHSGFRHTRLDAHAAAGDAAAVTARAASGQ